MEEGKGAAWSWQDRDGTKRGFSSENKTAISGWDSRWASLMTSELPRNSFSF